MDTQELKKEPPKELTERLNKIKGIPAKEIMDSIEIAYDVEERI